jgi:hypothetical protein
MGKASSQRSGDATPGGPGSTKSGQASDKPSERTQSGQANPQKSDQTGTVTSGTNVSTTQKTQIRSHLSSVKVKSAANVNITSVSIGTVVPTTIEQYWEPVPASIVEIVPAWRSYRVVKIHDEVVIIEPSTRKIVYVIEG